MKKIILCFLVSLIFLIPLWGAIDTDFLQKVYDLNLDRDKMLEYIETQIPLIEGIEEHRQIQSFWYDLDKESCQAHYEDLLKKNPKSPEFNYLAIRMLDREISSPKARKLISKFPKFYWNYRIIAVDLIEKSTKEDAEDYLKSKTYSKDVRIIKKGLKRFPDKDFLNAAQFSIYVKAKNTEKAKETIMKLNDPEALGSSIEIFDDFIAETKDYELFESFFRKLYVFMKNSPEFEDFVEANVLKIVRENSTADELIEYLEERPELKETPFAKIFLTEAHISKNNLDDAIDLGKELLESGDVNHIELKSLPFFEPLKDNPRWKQITAEAEAAWDELAPQRREEALNARINKEAPLWELQGLNDTTVKLEDLRGKIVILDFWATWCGPCTAAMPIINDWMKESMPKGVEVFSINTLEKEPEKAAEYMEENNFAMTFLYDGDETAAEYGVQGIPHICVIDKNGYIAFETVGFSRDLAEKLSLWIDILGEE